MEQINEVLNVRNSQILIGLCVCMEVWPSLCMDFSANNFLCFLIICAISDDHQQTVIVYIS